MRRMGHHYCGRSPECHRYRGNGHRCRHDRRCRCRLLHPWRGNRRRHGRDGERHRRQCHRRPHRSGSGVGNCRWRHRGHRGGSHRNCGGCSTASRSKSDDIERKCRWRKLALPSRAPWRSAGFSERHTSKPLNRRTRWTDDKGNIYEWDRQHGAVEKYSKNGKHLGEFDPNTGAQTKPPDPTRKPGRSPTEARHRGNSNLKRRRFATARE
ncbi:colicin E3/pyocin S6 family cytotoxin [Rhodococcus sp. 077-4]|uniref:colicin E3/pyocin S6 family cytotoxin n=1 Tax=Rhodococcus sp. 077-4 TaxID=2789271 RepID=UPI0039F566D2